MENFDISYWVRSPEIAKHLQDLHYGESTQEQMQLVRNAHHPLKEKADALWTLQRFAESAEEREPVKVMWNLYRLALREIRESKPGNFYLRKRVYKREGYTEIRVFPSWQALMDETAKLGYGSWMVEKHCAVSEGFLETVEFSLEWVDGQLCEVEFYLDDDNLPDETLKDALICKDLGLRHPYPLPFSTGDLVYLDAPHFPEPVAGVLYNEPDNNRDRYIFLGYIRDDSFTMIDLSYEEIAVTSGYRVIDWLHSAEPSMLPAGHEILAELGAYMKKLSQREAEDAFFHVFGIRRRDPLQVYRKTPITLEDLLRRETKEG